MISSPLGPGSLPTNDNLPDNPYAFCVDLDGQWFMQKGKMIAYYGRMRFEALTATRLADLVAQRFSSPLYVQDWVVADGKGKLLLGDRGFDINSFDLDQGNLTIRAANLLAFQPALELQQSIVPGFLTLLGTGKFLASSNGAVMFLDPPVRVDPQALVGWADCPSPSHHYDSGWMHTFLGAARSLFLGTRSGEELQLDFTGAGTVLLQSNEAMLTDRSVLRMVEGQLGMLSLAELHTLASRLQTQIAQRQR